MDKKKIYKAPRTQVKDLAAEGTFMLLAPSGSADHGNGDVVDLPNGGDDNQGREGDAKPTFYDTWE